MARPTRIVVYFDDGSETEIAAAGVGSIFLSEDKAVRCGHRPPYDPPPNQKRSTTEAMATTMETKCYLINGVIVCP